MNGIGELHCIGTCSAGQKKPALDNLKGDWGRLLRGVQDAQVPAQSHRKDAVAQSGYEG